MLNEGLFQTPYRSIFFPMPIKAHQPIPDLSQRPKKNGTPKGPVSRCSQPRTTVISFVSASLSAGT